MIYGLLFELAILRTRVLCALRRHPLAIPCHQRRSWTCRCGTAEVSHLSIFR